MTGPRFFLPHSSYCFQCTPVVTRPFRYFGMMAILITCNPFKDFLLDTNWNQTRERCRFQKDFWYRQNKLALIRSLYAILDLQPSIGDVTIENPYNLQDFMDDKLSTLDVKAIDDNKAIYDVEMQLTIYEGLVQRIVFYGCELYALLKLFPEAAIQLAT